MWIFFFTFLDSSEHMERARPVDYLAFLKRSRRGFSRIFGQVWNGGFFRFFWADMNLWIY